MEYQAWSDTLQAILITSLGMIILFLFPSAGNLGYAYLISAFIILVAVSGIVMLIFPQFLGYLIGLLMCGAGAIFITGDAWFPGIVSIVIGLVLLIFRHFLNYLVGFYLILLSLWFIFAAQSIVIGLVTVVIGVTVLFFPDVLSYIFGAYLLLAGFIAIGNYLHLF